ncbi:MAG TPA: peptidoglycan-binding protein, partial [Marmoricola sp.]|nr:peptidoglycan-binding protein [Marmoricola sp.]
METTVEQTFRLGDQGPAILEITSLLARLGLLEGAPGTQFDQRVEVAVRAFQQQRGLVVDGEVGPGTYRRLNETRWVLGDRILTHRPGDLMVGDDVYQLQQRLLELGFRVGRVDGYFGAETAAGLADFQANLGLSADGTCGPDTLNALARLSPLVRGGAPNAMRAQERIRAAGPNLGGKVIVIDISRAHRLPAECAE